MAFFDALKSIFSSDNKDARVFNVSGMHCEHCEKHVSESIRKIDGVRSVKASAKENRVSVVADAKVSDDEIKKAITEAGFTV